MFDKFFTKEYRRKRALQRAPAGVMRDFLSVSLPTDRNHCDEVEIVALDLETTGLDPRKDSILSIGLVSIRGMCVDLSTARHEVIRIDRPIPEASAVIHHITDDHSAAGLPLELVLPDLLRFLAGKVMLVHYANIEQNFIDAACRQLYGAPFIMATIDTLVLGHRVFERMNHSIQPGDLRLFNLRPRYNLPMYKAHNALSDALGTAELFLAMVADMAPKQDKCQLGQFLRR